MCVCVWVNVNEIVHVRTVHPSLVSVLVCHLLYNVSYNRDPKHWHHSNGRALTFLLLLGQAHVIIRQSGPC